MYYSEEVYSDDNVQSSSSYFLSSLFSLLLSPALMPLLFIIVCLHLTPQIDNNAPYFSCISNSSVLLSLLLFISLNVRCH